MPLSLAGQAMKLAIHSDVSYLLELKARSRAGGHMFMASTEDIPINNGVVGSVKYFTNNQSSAVISNGGQACLSNRFPPEKNILAGAHVLDPQPVAI